MSYDARGLTPLLAAGPFSMWHYRTTDSLSGVMAPGYFASAAERLLVGHLLVVQAADAMGFVPMRDVGVVGSGHVLDAIGSPVQLDREVMLRFGVSGAVSVTVSGATAVTPRVLEIATIPDLQAVGGTFAVRATAQGPVRELRHTLLDASGTAVGAPVAAAVTAGVSQAVLTVPPAGAGYRVRVVDADDVQLTTTSPPFSVIQAPTVPVGADTASLLTEGGATLFLDNGDRLTV